MTLRLRPWPFPKDEEAELIWFGSPFIDYRGSWKIRTAFNIGEEIKVHSYPWGTLPDLRIGQIYVNGVYDQVKPKSGSVYHLQIKSLNEGNVTNGFELPKRIIDFQGNKELGLQKIIHYSVNGVSYCIPVIELIRAMFLNAKYLAYYILQPHGLDLLIEKSLVLDKVLHFDLSNRVPTKEATKTNARHLSWIHVDQRIHSMWNSVYQNLYRQAVRKSSHNPMAALKQGMPLEVDLSDVGPLELYIRGVKFGSYVLVKEIMSIGGFRHPSKEILFWHHSKKRREWSSGEKAIKITDDDKFDDYVLNEHSEHAKENTHQDVIEAPPTIMQFVNYPHVDNRYTDIKLSNTGTEVISAGRGGKLAGEKEVSTQDSIVGGDTQPIDFQTLEIVPASEAFGLEAFFKMIQILKESYPVSIKMSVLRVPPGKRFSVCANGARRTCAIVQVASVTATSYIVEVARPDDWSISTLILRPAPSTSFHKVEKDIKKLLDGLVRKGGHWDQSVLDQCRVMNIEKLKHYSSDSVRGWANKVISKIITI